MCVCVCVCVCVKSPLAVLTVVPVQSCSVSNLKHKCLFTAGTDELNPQ